MTAGAAAGGGAAMATALSAEARLKALYSIMQSIENKLGGGEGVEGLYGSIKKSGMDKVLQCMQHKCGLDGRSVLLDVGAGLGRPLMHALLVPGIAGARGIEIDRIKCDKAAAFLQQAVRELQRRGLAGGKLAPPPVECSAIEKVRSLDGCTHAYSFWEGVPTEGKAAFGSLFAASRTLQSVAVVQRAIRTCPLAYMEELGFGQLELVGSFSVSMSGSGRSFTAYIFNKANLPPALPAPLVVDEAAAQSVQTPAQASEPVAAATVTGAVAASAEVEGESAQSRPAAARAMLAQAVGVPPAQGRGCRHRKPSAKQQLAAGQELLVEEEAAGARGQRSGVRQLRAEARGASNTQGGAAEGQQAPMAAGEQQQQQGRQGGGSPSRATRSRAAPRPAAGKPAAAKLGSPQKAGVQKKTSPAKGGSTSPRTLQQAEQKAVASRRLSLEVDSADAKSSVEAPALAPGGGGLLQRAARVVKSGVAEGGAKLRLTRQAVATRRGLQGGQ